MKKSLVTRIASVSLGLSLICGGKVNAVPSKTGKGMALLCNCLVPGGAAFATGKTAQGVLEFFTLNYLGVGAIVDVVKILGGNYVDSEGNKLENWSSES